jgi:hypothetical protein
VLPWPSYPRKWVAGGRENQLIEDGIAMGPEPASRWGTREPFCQLSNIDPGDRRRCVKRQIELVSGIRV